MQGCYTQKQEQISKSPDMAKICKERYASPLRRQDNTIFTEKALLM